ncbi:uncharacterized protein LOC143353941 isoform X1 [Halictus rubicundus]|uniref:uncharacterized protein LOC143353941 isoform X1 n=2 Tax=Halictus rubicundus TaxID=77578 RepID=UPI0040366925
MVRPVDRPPSFRQRANEWIYKMLFLWSREPAPPSPKASPWFAWFATALVLWGCRRSVMKAVLTISPLRLLKKRNILPIANSKASSTVTLAKQHQKRLKLENPILQRKHKHGIRRMKRFCNGDGPHVTSSTSVIQIPQIHYRVTRSGKIYGKYPHKTTVPTNANQGVH